MSISMANRYKNIVLEEEKLVVSDEFHDFSIAKLSAVAQERILLALRIRLPGETAYS